jgi:geranylgeranyl reductase family protein
MSVNSFDVIIVGAGPAGCTAALFLAGSGSSVALIDRAQFPREIACGDALGGQVVNILKRMPGEVHTRFREQVPKTPVSGIRLFSPGYHILELPYPSHPAGTEEPGGYICRRRDFDNFLLSEVRLAGNVCIYEDLWIRGIEKKKDQIHIETGTYHFRSDIVLGADGVNSVVRKSIGVKQAGRTYGAMAIRGYFRNVTGFHPGSYIDLYFLHYLLPEYFWIFPETAGTVNAGLGMKNRQISRNKVSLKNLFSKIIEENPDISARFTQAIAVSPLSARELAISRRIGRVSGDRFLLLGDAARLVDPFLGDGIGNAMASGEVAASVLIEHLKLKKEMAVIGKAYEEKLRRRIGPEHSTGELLHKLAGYPRLLNMIARKAGTNERFRNLLSSALADESARLRLNDPMLYLRILLNR